MKRHRPPAPGGSRPPSKLTPPALRLMLAPYLRRLTEAERSAEQARVARGVGRVKVTWNGRLRTAIGRTDPAGARIYLNPRLLDRYPQELVPTLVHELCHVAAGLRAGHGPRWKRLMEHCGFPAETHHDLDVSEFEVKRRTWRWLCRRCDEVYVRKSRAARHYQCGRCGGDLRVAERREAAREAKPRRSRPRPSR